MNSCLNGATTMPYSLESDVKTAAKTGFQGVEIWKSKLDQFLQDKSVENLRDLLMQHSIDAVAICAFSGYVLCSEEEFKKKVEETKKYLEIASYIGCKNIVVCAEGFESKIREKIVEAHASRLNKLAKVSEAYNVKVAMEWFWNLKDAIEVVERASNDYLGLVVDTFHWYRGDGNLGNIDLIPTDKLFLVHINDCEDLPRERLSDKNRLYCGLGAIPLTEILKRFKQKNYQGYLSVEIFREEYWKKDPLTISKEAFESLTNVMKLAKVL
ncbi:MAG: sugar phosphate isomerase/epimerase family protein [Thermoproteota archaeon]